MKINRIAVATVVSALACFVIASPAFAAGSGYAPGQSFGSSQAGGGTLSVVTAQTVTSATKTVTATSGSTNLNLDVPSGAFPTGAEIVIAAGTAGNVTGLPSGTKAVDDFEVSFLNNSGGSITPVKPVTFVIKDSSIHSNAVVYKATAQGLQKVNSTVKAGEVSISFTTDPEFVVTQPPVVVPNATQPVTGMPIADMLAGGVILVALGSWLAFSRRKAR